MKNEIWLIRSGRKLGNKDKSFLIISKHSFITEVVIRTINKNITRFYAKGIGKIFNRNFDFTIKGSYHNKQINIEKGFVSTVNDNWFELTI